MNKNDKEKIRGRNGLVEKSFSSNALKKNVNIEGA